MLIKLNLQRFAAVIYAITMNYDSNVTSVDDNDGTVFTTSGETKTVFNANTTYTFTVAMSQGYELDSVTSDKGNISNVSGNSFQFVNSYDRTATITITTKKATFQVSIDLTTLSGWGNVADGQHSIQVVAKADNYRDSEKSTGVSFTKSGGSVTYLLNTNPDVFTIEQYNANFTSNGQQFTTIDLQASGMFYDETLVYYDGGPEGMVWTNDAFRTLVFDEEPTGDLLAWLNANGTRQ